MDILIICISIILVVGFYGEVILFGDELENFLVFFFVLKYLNLVLENFFIVCNVNFLFVKIKVWFVIYKIGVVNIYVIK